MASAVDDGSSQQLPVPNPTLAADDILEKVRQDMEVRIQEVVRQQLLDQLAVDRGKDEDTFVDNPVVNSSVGGSGIEGYSDHPDSSASLGRPRSIFAAGTALCTRGSAASVSEVDPMTRVQFVLACLTVAALQSMVMLGVYKGISEPSCNTYLDCPDGHYCARYTYKLAAKVNEGNLGECAGCLSNDAETRNIGRLSEHCWIPPGESDRECLDGWSNATAFCALANLSDYMNGIDGCEACYDPTDPYHGDGWNKGTSEVQKVIDALGLMRGVDYLALCLVSIVVGLYVSNEWADIKLCEILIAQRFNGEDPMWMKASFLAISSLRQFGFLPLLTATVVQLVAHHGSTALEICFNGVAIIFILEIECVSCWLCIGVS